MKGDVKVNLWVFWLFFMGRCFFVIRGVGVRGRDSFSCFGKVVSGSGKG